MKQKKRVTIYTQVYNTKDYLDQCISSVLKQTYPHFEYILIDNGCTDGSSEILTRYAQQDQRIRLFQFKENQVEIINKFINEYATGQYYTILDSDDWWEPDYLEQLVTFLEDNNLDLAITGCIAHYEWLGTSEVFRKLDAPVCFNLAQFVQVYPHYWTYPSTNWGSLMRLELHKQIDFRQMIEAKYVYGGDTIRMLSYIDQCKRIGINDQALYHYRIHLKSNSYRYNPRRFDADIAYYEHIRDFLDRHQALDPPKEFWLKRVYFGSTLNTLDTLLNAKNAPEEKVSACARIARHPLTALALTADCEERDRFRTLMGKIFSALLQVDGQWNCEDLRAICGVVAPDCVAALADGSTGLYRQDQELREALCGNQPTALGLGLLERIRTGRYSGRWPLGQLLAGLFPHRPIAAITDEHFYRSYPEVCRAVIQGDYLSALDQLTDRLLGEGLPYDPETALELFLSLAARENQVPAFLFGKVQLAALCLEQGRAEECAALLRELEEMGMEDNEDTLRLKAALQKREPTP